jgi:hypothetical protein
LDFRGEAGLLQVDAKVRGDGAEEVRDGQGAEAIRLHRGVRALGGFEADLAGVRVGLREFVEGAAEDAPPGVRGDGALGALGVPEVFDEAGFERDGLADAAGEAREEEAVIRGFGGLGVRGRRGGGGGPGGGGGGGGGRFRGSLLGGEVSFGALRGEFGEFHAEFGHALALAQVAHDAVRGGVFGEEGVGGDGGGFRWGEF